MRVLIFVLCFALSWCVSAVSQADTVVRPDVACAPGTLRVGLVSYPPLVSKLDDGSWSGLAVELWRSVAERSNLSFCYVEVEAFQDLFPTLGNTTDILIGGLTMTEARERKFGDFTAPFMHTGLRIVTKGSVQPTIYTLATELNQPLARSAILTFFALIVLGGVLVWLIERNTNEQIPKPFFSGVAAAMWFIFAVKSTCGFGDVVARRFSTRCIAVLMWVAGLVTTSIVVGTIIAAITVSKLESTIAAPEDLRGRAVAVPQYTAAVDIAKSFGARVIETSSAQEAMELVAAGRADASIYDEVYLDNYVRQHAGDNLVVVGPLLSSEFFAFVVPEGSPYREIINRAILMITRGNEWHSVQRRYLGTR